MTRWLYPTNFPQIDLALIYLLLVILCPVTSVAHEFGSFVSSLSNLNSWFFIYHKNFNS